VYVLHSSCVEAVFEYLHRSPESGKRRRKVNNILIILKVQTLRAYCYINASNYMRGFYSPASSCCRRLWGIVSGNCDCRTEPACLLIY
jgi:hypothetical protein